MISYATIIFLISVPMISYAHNYTTFFMGRLFQGVGVGMITIAVPLYLSEAMPTAMRGRGLVAFQLFLTIGIFAASWVNVLFAASQNWRDMFLTAGIPGVVMLLGCFVLLESPVYLAMKGRFDRVKRVLSATRSEKEAELELQELQETLDMKNAVQSQNEAGIAQTLKLLGQKCYLYPVLLVCSIAILQQALGINSFLQLGATILHDVGLSSNVTAILGTTAITGMNLLLTIVAFAIVERFERRQIVAFGLSIAMCSLFFLALAYHFMPPGVQRGYMVLAGLVGFICGYAIGPGALVWALLSELLPTRLRSVFLGVALFLNSMTSTLLAGAFMWLVAHIGYSGIFIVCGTAAFIYLMVVLRYVPNVKGKTLEEIEMHFINKYKGA